MSESLRELLQRGADTVERPRFDVGDLVSRAERRVVRRRLATAMAAAAAVVLIVAAGPALVPDERPAPAGPGPAETEPRTFYYDKGTHLRETGERNVVVKPGVYTVPFSGWGDLPPEVADLRAVVAFPEGWTSLHRSTFEKDTSDKDVALEFWTVERVPEDLCAGGRPSADLTDPGPTVAALANALAAQPRLAGTNPSPVTIGGHDGLYVELTRPPSWRCAGGPLWVAPRIVHAAYPEGFVHAGDVARVWILDVDGDRVVINSVHPSGTPQEDVDEVTRIVESTTFTTLEQP
jgi:hypothetical protein